MKTRRYNTRSSSSSKSREDFRVSPKSSTMKTRRYNTRSSSSLKSRKREENPSYQPIPFDLMNEMLTRLPAKSIARIRCLSKLYASTLRTPNFTDSFFTISSSRPKILFTVLKQGKTFFFSSPQPQNPSTDFHMSFPINCPAEVSRPVNGFVCGLNQQNLNGRIVTTPLICNPSTGQSFNLPRVKTRRRNVISYLGYDPSEKQFKVLCMTMSCVGPSFSEEHQVLTLETGKKPSWRMIKCDIRHAPLKFRDRHNVYDGICINGVFYYFALAWKEFYGGFPDIVCFDIKSENFSFIKRDEGMNVDWGFRTEITWVNYKGKLAMLQPHIVNRVYTGIQLWVLEDTEKHEWARQIYVLPHPWKDIVEETKLCLVGTTSRGEIVLSPNSLSDSFYLVYYDPETNTLTKVGIQGMEDFQPRKAYTFLDHVENVKLMKIV